MEAVNIPTPGIHHLALRVNNLDRSKEFYLNKLGFPNVLESSGMCIFQAGGTFIALLAPNGNMPENDSFNPHRIGLDHLALGCENVSELERVAKALNEHNIENTGIKHDVTLDKDYIAFKDPDRISWEFYSI